MKILSGILILLSLWGCGPEESSAQKDQAQSNEELLQRRALYTPFGGKTYKGTITKLSGGIVDVVLTLSYSEQQVNNPSRIEMTGVPTLAGTLNICMLQTPCFDTNMSNKDGVNILAVTSGNRNVSGKQDLVLYIQGSCPAGGCNGISTAVDASKNLDLIPTNNNNELDGTYLEANAVERITLTKVQ